jgi:hypothetical protein
VKYDCTVWNPLEWRALLSHCLPASDFSISLVKV